MPVTAIDRTATLRSAEKLLRVGKLKAAITEYAKVVRESPQDWDTALTLASLHARAGDADAAITRYRAVAAGMADAGDATRAAGVLDKVLALKPGDEDTLEELAGLLARAGDLAGASAHLTRIADRRIARGDLPRAIDALERAASYDPASASSSRLFELCVQTGDLRRARAHVSSARDCRSLATVLQHAGQEDEARELLREAFERDPSDLSIAAVLARDYIRAGNSAAAADFLTPSLVGTDPDARIAAAEILLRSGHADAALQFVTLLLADGPAQADRVARLACAAAPHVPDTAFAFADLAVTRCSEQRQWERAVQVLQDFTTAVPSNTAALVRLIEVAVDGDLMDVVTRGQELLADAYLSSGDVAEGLHIAQDLSERDPQNPRYAALLNRALMLSGTTDNDVVVPMRAAR
jgi:tetratricopeptide (TPR) repeat protein